MAEPADPLRLSGFRSFSIFFHAALRVLLGFGRLGEVELFYYVDVVGGSKCHCKGSKVWRLDLDCGDDKAVGG